MIICFSGTGNTRLVADELQARLGDEVVRYAPGLMCAPQRIRQQVDDGRVIWAFPVFCWGLPVKADEIMRRMVLFSNDPVRHYMVCTCGDDIGLTEQQWRRLCASRGWQTAGAYSVQMPNTFTFMKGFDVDPDDVADAKLEAMPDRVEYIASRIKAGVGVESDVVRGSWPWLKSRVVRPWFNRFKVGCSHFHATDACTGCGRCARNCPFAAISMVDGRPHWQGQCTLCSRCYQVCPRHAVAYDKATEGKGQYICPGFSLKP